MRTREREREGDRQREREREMQKGSSVRSWIIEMLAASPIFALRRCNVRSNSPGDCAYPLPSFLLPAAAARPSSFASAWSCGEVTAWSAILVLLCFKVDYRLQETPMGTRGNGPMNIRSCRALPATVTPATARAATTATTATTVANSRLAHVLHVPRDSHPYPPQGTRPLVTTSN